MSSVNIFNNNFFDDSSTIKYNVENNNYDFDWSNLQSEAAALKNRVSDNDPLKPAVTELESAISSRNKESVSSVIAKYAGAFASSTFANMASAGLIALIKSLV